VQDRRGHAVIADNDDRLAMMGQGFEMTLLRIVESRTRGDRIMVKDSGSVTGGKGMTVAPSPLNEVKLDLGIILAVGGVLLLLVQGRIAGRVSRCNCCCW
jgi:hypothetical protein